MNVNELDFDLPAEQIAQRPLGERDASRMLLLDRVSGEWEDKQFRELPKLLRGDELVVVNNVKVLPARLFGRRIGIHSETPGHNNSARNEFLQAPIEVLLVRQIGADTWEALVRPGRKVPAGERIVFGDGELEALVEGRGEYGLRVLRFTSKSGFHEALGRLGHIPLPPYIKRADEPLDRERYQTVYAKRGCASQRQPQACILRRRSSQNCAAAASRSRRLRSRSDSAPSSLCAPKTSRTMQYTPKPTKFR